MHVYIASRYDQFLWDLETLVNVDSGSGYAPGLATVARFFRERFERLGWHARALEFDGGSAPCLEVANRQGLPADERFDFLFLGHMDTVFPVGTAAHRPFSIRDGRAWGPGVCDMKGGLVTMLHAAEAIEQAGFAGDLSIGIAFNSDEEIGSPPASGCCSAREWPTSRCSAAAGPPMPAWNPRRAPTPCWSSPARCWR